MQGGAASQCSAIAAVSLSPTSGSAPALRLAQEAGVQRLVLFHHAPDRTDDELDRIVADVQRAAGSGLRVEAAAEGRQIVLGRCATGEGSRHAHPLP
ncbi:MAG: hypothetical protein ACRELV_14840 [Longimicrobiales bacterium]